MTTSTTTTTANEARDHFPSSSSYKGIPALQPARVKISFSNNKPTEKSASSVEIRKRHARDERNSHFMPKLREEDSHERVCLTEESCISNLIARIKMIRLKITSGRFARGVTKKRHCVSV